RRRPVCREQSEVAGLDTRGTLDGQTRIVQPIDLAAREEPCRDTAVGERGFQAVEVLRIGIRERLEKDGAQRREDRRRRTDAEGEGSDRREGESRRAAESAEGDP